MSDWLKELDRLERHGDHSGECDRLVLDHARELIDAAKDYKRLLGAHHIVMTSLAECIQENSNLKALLKRVEWVGTDGYPFCQLCFMEKDGGHRDNCELAEAIK